ncbi:hypothetical protein IscW_ISCW019268, partial [Ixodes scapularis]
KYRKKKDGRSERRPNGRPSPPKKRTKLKMARTPNSVASSRVLDTRVIQSDRE